MTHDERFIPAQLSCCVIIETGMSFLIVVRAMESAFIANEAIKKARIESFFETKKPENERDR